MEFADLVQEPGERHIVYGGTRSGKSSLMDWSVRHIQETRPQFMGLIADTKPRFRAETIAYGPNNAFRKDASKLYTSWTKGPMLPNSVVVNLDSAHPFRGLWSEKRPGEVAIMQSDEPRRWQQMIGLMGAFAARHTPTERLLVVDEAMDFYQRNTLGIDPKNDVILRTARAGGERNIGLLLGAHRPYGIPPLLNTLSSRVSLFYIRFQKDMRYLWEMGVPETEFPPDGNYIFKQYTIKPGGLVSDPMTSRLHLPDWYLEQLSST
jgi:hypothetical protein